jgi:hypothetical protein
MNLSTFRLKIQIIWLLCDSGFPLPWCSFLEDDEIPVDTLEDQSCPKSTYKAQVSQGGIIWCTLRIALIRDRTYNFLALLSLEYNPSWKKSVLAFNFDTPN